MKRSPPATKIYRPQSHVSGHELNGFVSPTYRGFRLACLASEIEAKKRAIDNFWSNAYANAATLAQREAVLAEEASLRFEPREWTGA